MTGDLDGVAAAVAVNAHPPPRRGGGDLGGCAQPFAFQPRRRPRLPVRGGAGAYRAALLGNRVGDRGTLRQQRPTVVGGVADDVDAAVGKLVGQQRDQLSGQPHRGVGALAAPQPQQHRQAHRVRAERQPHHDPRDNPPIAAAERVRVLRGNRRGSRTRRTPSAPTAGSGCRRPPRRSPRARRAAGPRSAEPASARSGRRPTRGGRRAHRVKRHHRGHPRPGQHAHHGAPPGLRHQAGSQQREHRERAAAPEAGPECLQQRTPRVGYGQPLEASADNSNPSNLCSHRRCFVTSTPGLWRRAGTLTGTTGLTSPTRQPSRLKTAKSSPPVLQANSCRSVIT